VLNRKIQRPKQIYTHACNAKANTFQTLRRDLLISVPFILVIDLFQTLPLGGFTHVRPSLINPLQPVATAHFQVLEPRSLEPIVGRHRHLYFNDLADCRL
jgi:hypothetical protein